MRRGPLVTCAATVQTFVLILAAGTGARGYVRPGTTHRVSVGPRGIEANFDSNESAISADGRYIAFTSDASNLVDRDLNLIPDTFVHDRLRGKTTRVSVSSADTEARDAPADFRRGSQGAVAITPKGRYVVFRSSAFNLVPDDTNNTFDIFVRDRKNGSTTRISVSSDGKQANAGSSDPVSITADGRWVVFSSAASNLVKGDTNNAGDVFMHDRRTKKTTMISRPPDGQPQEGNHSSFGTISTTGRYVEFASTASNLVEGTPEHPVFGSQSFHFVYDRSTKDFDVVSVDSHDTPVQAGGTSGNPHVSDNGRYVTFFSNITGFVPNESARCATCPAVYVHDRKLGRTERISVTSAGEEGIAGSPQGDPFFGPGSFEPSMSADGRFVVFGSSSQLEEGDSGTMSTAGSFGTVPIASDMDVYMHDRLTGSTIMVSRDSKGREAEKCPFPQDFFQVIGPALSRWGDFVSWSSCSTNLVPHEKKGPNCCVVKDENDVFLREVGRALSAELGGEPGEPPPPPFCIGPVCLPPQTAIARADPAQDISTAAGIGDLISLKIAYRPLGSDLFVRLDATRVAPSNLGHLLPPAPFYGVRLKLRDKIFEVRASWNPSHEVPTSAGTFALYDCSDGACMYARDLAGGYGTVGEAVVVSIPLDAISYRSGDRLKSMTGFSRLTPIGPDLDRIRLVP